MKLRVCRVKFRKLRPNLINKRKITNINNLIRKTRKIYKF